MNAEHVYKKLNNGYPFGNTSNMSIAKLKIDPIDVYKDDVYYEDIVNYTGKPWFFKIDLDSHKFVNFIRFWDIDTVNYKWLYFAHVIRCKECGLEFHLPKFEKYAVTCEEYLMEEALR